MIEQDALIVAIGPAMTEAAAELSGPKVARLGELDQLGLDVPQGFAVTTAAFQHALAASGLQAQLASLEQDSVAAAPEQLADIARQMRDLTSNITIPADLAERIRTALMDLESKLNKPGLRLAVRSSATGEDAADKSFAGQYESYLGVSGSDDLLRAIRDCWASLFNDRALDYRNRAGRSFLNSPMAVGVVELIEAHAAGVAFSVDPVSGHRDRIVLESTWGFGEALVQGLISPDRFKVDKAEIRIIEQSTGDKTQQSLFDPKSSRVVERPMPKEKRQSCSLESGIALRIAQHVEALEAKIGAPVDVEWVIEQHDNNAPRLVFVQMRPISTLATEPALPSWRDDKIAETWR